MFKHTIAIAAFVATTGAASAAVISGNDSFTLSSPNTVIPAASDVSVAGNVITLTLTDEQPAGTQDAAGNARYLLDLDDLGFTSGPYTIDAVGWDVTVTTLSGTTVFADSAIAIYRSNGTQGVQVDPFDGNFGQGTASAASSGLIHISPDTIPVFNDGKIFVEVFGNQAFGYELDGTVSIRVVPAPASVALMGLGAVSCRRRRRS